MKLYFEKNNDNDIKVFIVNKGKEKIEFSYAEMIKRMYDDGIVEDSIMEGPLSEDERKSINELTDELKNLIIDRIDE